MTDNPTRAALYARVSSDQQKEAGTIDSQVTELEARIQRDGLMVEQELYFKDDGCSGATLVRPALEALRDQAAAGAFERLRHEFLGLVQAGDFPCPV